LERIEQLVGADRIRALDSIDRYEAFEVPHSDRRFPELRGCSGSCPRCWIEWILRWFFERLVARSALLIGKLWPN
jgi:hypothetical protein